MLTRPEQTAIMQLVKQAVTRATAQGRKLERHRQRGTPPDPELYEPVAETLDELRDYLKEVGHPPSSKSTGVIPCIPQQRSPSDSSWFWPSLPNRKR